MWSPRASHADHFEGINLTTCHATNMVEMESLGLSILAPAAGVSLLFTGCGPIVLNIIGIARLRI